MNVLITGTGSGFGNGLAKFYIEQGDIVFGISRKIALWQKKNRAFRFLPQNVSRFREIETKIISFLKDVKKLDLIILNAGVINDIKLLKDTSLVEIKKVMDINVWANKIIIDTLFKSIPEIKQVVAISSGASVSGSLGWNAYSLSKATLNMLVNQYAKEHTETHFCALAPGLIDSNMQDYIFSLPKEKEFPAVKKLKKAKQSGEMPSIEEAAKINAKAIQKVVNYQSGSFLDVRNLE